MIVRDKIWGEFDIKEDVLLELMRSKEMKRLKRIAQYGLQFEMYPLSGFSRYEHSVGVMLLLRKLGANIEEQSAGLLHDVSHTAFSHIVDWVIGNRKDENYQDERHEEVIRGSGIPAVLAKYNMNLERIINLDNYPLLEREAPDLCADRVDYAIREFYYWASPYIVDACTESLINHNCRILFNSRDSAMLFGENYLLLQREHWGGAEWMLRWQIFSDLLKYGIKERIISEKDFAGNDKHVLGKMRKSENINIKNGLDKLSGKLKFDVLDENNEEYDFHLKKKFRYVDPEYFQSGKVHQLSEESEKFRELLERERSHNLNGIKIKLLA